MQWRPAGVVRLPLHFNCNLHGGLTHDLPLSKHAMTSTFMICVGCLCTEKAFFLISIRRASVTIQIGTKIIVHYLRTFGCSGRRVRRPPCRQVHHGSGLLESRGCGPDLIVRRGIVVSLLHCTLLYVLCSANKLFRQTGRSHGHRAPICSESPRGACCRP